MDRLQRLNCTLDYIEKSLASDIEYKKIARLAGCSFSHFHRLFSFLTNVTLAEYIRRRRLTLAASELQNEKTRIIDLALIRI